MANSLIPDDLPPIEVIPLSQAGDLSGSPQQWLQSLSEPLCLRIAGTEQGAPRALCTLIHGNEPSGFKAIHRFLKQELRPCHDLLLIIASVPAARHQPLFSHRMLPGQRDLNRCFSGPFDDPPGQLAGRILATLQQHQPACLIDMHNTSGSGPAFAVSTVFDRAHMALTALFTDKLIVTDLRLGALMEFSEQGCPTVTIECGGSQDPAADLIAWEGLKHYATREHLQSGARDYPLQVYQNPWRLELAEDTPVAYGDQPVTGIPLTLVSDIEVYNYSLLTPDQSLGWLAEALDMLRAIDGSGQNRIHDFFTLRDGQLYPKVPLKPFMITSNPEIARKDCLLYFVAAQ